MMDEFVSPEVWICRAEGGRRLCRVTVGDQGLVPFAPEYRKIPCHQGFFLDRGGRCYIRRRYDGTGPGSCPVETGDQSCARIARIKISTAGEKRRPDIDTSNTSRDTSG